MMHVSRFTPDPSRQAEFLGVSGRETFRRPPAVEVADLSGEPRRMMLLWEGDDQAAAYIERALGEFGVLETESVTDATPGLEAAFARNLDAFGAWMSERGATSDAMTEALEIRRLGKEASTPAEAAERGRAWELRRSRSGSATNARDRDGARHRREEAIIGFARMLHGSATDRNAASRMSP